MSTHADPLLPPPLHPSPLHLPLHRMEPVLADAEVKEAGLARIT